MNNVHSSTQDMRSVTVLYGDLEVEVSIGSKMSIYLDLEMRAAIGLKGDAYVVRMVIVIS